MKNKKNRKSDKNTESNQGMKVDKYGTLVITNKKLLKRLMQTSFNKQSEADNYRVTVVCETPESELLALKRHKRKSFGKHWGGQGGRVDAGETLKYAAQRESDEETGYFPKDITPAMLEITKKGRLTLTFIAHCKEKFKPDLDNEHTKPKWVDGPDNWPKRRHPTINNLIKFVMKSEKEYSRKKPPD